MHSISRLIKIIIFISIICPMIYAQLPDIFNPLYEFEEHILQPEQAKVCHVLSCIVYKNNELYEEIFYDGNGNVISNNNGKAYYNYKGQDVLSIVHYDPECNKDLDTYFDYDENKILTKIRRYYENSNSEEVLYYSYYNDGPLGQIMHQSYNEDNNEMSQIKTEYGYEANQCNIIKRTTSIAWASSKAVKYSFVELLHFTDGRLDLRETRQFKSDNSTVDENFRYKYDNNNRLSKICLIKDLENEKDIEWFTYDNKGLLLSRKTEHEDYRYDYKFMKTARLNIDISDETEDIEIFQYWKNYDHRTLGKAPGKWSLDIYIPGLEFFIIRLSEDIKYPVMLEPGKTINVKYADGKFIEVDNDPSNNMIWEIENHKRIYSGILTKDGLYQQMREKVDEKFRANYHLPVFLYYSHIYDLRYIEREKDAFDEFADLLAGPEENYFSFIKKYAKNMIDRYPLNPLAIQKYCYNKQ